MKVSILASAIRPALSGPFFEKKVEIEEE